MENSLLLRFYSKFTQFDFLSFSPFLSFLTLVTELWALPAYAHFQSMLECPKHQISVSKISTFCESQRALNWSLFSPIFQVLSQNPSSLFDKVSPKSVGMLESSNYTKWIQTINLSFCKSIRKTVFYSYSAFRLPTFAG